MKTYRITEDARLDLIEIAQYTLKKWGEKALIKYRDGLENTFNAIANHAIMKKSFSKKIKQCIRDKISISLYLLRCSQ